MEKTIRVVDEYGNSYQPTYPKRAKGLVRSGRARFLTEDTICLTASMEELLDDPADEMEEAEFEDEMEETSMEPLQETANEPQWVKMTDEEVEELCRTFNEEHACIREYLERLRSLCEDTGYLSQASSTLEKIPNDAPEDVARLKIEAIRDIVAEREKTIQNLMDHYMTLLYDV